MITFSIFRPKAQTQAPPPPEIASVRAIDLVAEALHRAEAMIAGREPRSLAALSEYDQRVLRGHAALVLNARDHDKLARELERAAVRLHLTYPEFAVTMACARALASCVLSTWVSGMTGERRRS